MSEEVVPHLIKVGLRAPIACGSQCGKDSTNDLAWPAEALRRHSDQCPMIACEVLMPVDVAIPLSAISSMLIALVLNDDLECEIDEVDAADWASVVADHDVAFRRR